MRGLLKNAKYSRRYRRYGALLVFEVVNQKVFQKNQPLNDAQKQQAKANKLQVSDKQLNTMTERDLLKILKTI